MGNGVHGRFAKGEHWREPKPFWNRDWLVFEYVEMKRSAAEIAADFDLWPQAINFWLKKHGIPTRSTSGTRAVKHLPERVFFPVQQSARSGYVRQNGYDVR